MAILRYILRLKNSVVSYGAQRVVQSCQIVPVDEKIQIHGLPRSPEHTESKTTDGGVSDLVTGELRDKPLENDLEIHAAL